MASVAVAKDTRQVSSLRNVGKRIEAPSPGNFVALKQRHAGIPDSRPLSLFKKPSMEGGAQQIQKQRTPEVNSAIDRQPTKEDSTKQLSMNVLVRQTTEMISQLTSSVEEGEQLREVLEQKIFARTKFYEEIKSKVETIDAQRVAADASARAWEDKVSELERDLSDVNKRVACSLSEQKKSSSEKGSLMRKLQAAENEVTTKKAEAETDQQQIVALQDELAKKRFEVVQLQHKNKDLAEGKAEVDAQRSQLVSSLDIKSAEFATLKQQADMLAAKVSALASMNALAAHNMDTLLQELTRTSLCIEQEKLEKERSLRSFREADKKNHELLIEINNLQHELRSCRQRLEDLQASHLRSITDAAEAKKIAEECISSQQNLIETTLQERKKDQEELAALSTVTNALKEEKANLMKDISKLTDDSASAITALEQAVEARQDKLESLEKELDILNCLQKATAEDLKRTQENSELIAENFQKLQEQHKEVQKKLDETQEKLILSEKANEASKKDGQAKLEAKQLELQRHLRELSAQNNQAVTEMRKQYEAETNNAIVNERQKAAMMVEDVKRDHEKSLQLEREAMRAQADDLTTKHKHELSELARKNEEDKMGMMEEHKMLWSEREKELQAALEKVEQTWKVKWNKEAETFEEQRSHLAMRLQENQGALEGVEIRNRELTTLNEELTRSMQDYGERLRKSEDAVQQGESKYLAEKLEHEQAICSLKEGYENKLKEVESVLTLEKARYEAFLRRFSNDMQRELNQNVLGVTSSAEAGQSQIQLLENTTTTVRGTVVNVSSGVETLRDTGRNATMRPPSKKGDAAGRPLVKSRKQKRASLPKMTMQPIPDSDDEENLTKEASAAFTKSDVTKVPDPNGGKKAMKRKRENKVKDASPAKSGSMGELFGSESMNPYLDDPYAF